MMELYNDNLDKTDAKTFLELKNKLDNNLIKVKGDKNNNKIIALVYNKVELKRIDVYLLEELVNEALSSFSGISYELKGNDLVIKVETSKPDI